MQKCFFGRKEKPSQENGKKKVFHVLIFKANSVFIVDCFIVFLS